MKILVDANVLVKSSKPTEPLHGVAVNAVNRLLTAGSTLCLVPQCYYEFWVTATRPVENRGLGFRPDKAAQVIATFQETFTRLADPPDLLASWLDLVLRYDCKGKIAHDARLVAAMSSIGIGHLLTFNGQDFARFPGVTVLDPATLPR